MNLTMRIVAASLTALTAMVTFTAPASSATSPEVDEFFTAYETMADKYADRVDGKPLLMTAWNEYYSYIAPNGASRIWSGTGDSRQLQVCRPPKPNGEFVCYNKNFTTGEWSQTKSTVTLNGESGWQAGLDAPTLVLGGVLSGAGDTLNVTTSPNRIVATGTTESNDGNPVKFTVTVTSTAKTFSVVLDAPGVEDLEDMTIVSVKVTTPKKITFPN